MVNCKNECWKETQLVLYDDSAHDSAHWLRLAHHSRNTFHNETKSDLAYRVKSASLFHSTPGDVSRRKVRYRLRYRFPPPRTKVAPNASFTRAAC